MNIKKLSPFILLLVLGCSSNNDQASNQFESEYTLEEQQAELNGLVTFDLLSNDYVKFYIETDCNLGNNCPKADMYIVHDFDTNLVFTKNFDIDSVSLSNTLLFPDGRCSVPFSGDSGTLEIMKTEEGSLSGTFDLGLKEMNGYRPSPSFQCSENTYSSDSIRSLTYEGTFIATEIE